MRCEGDSPTVRPGADARSKPGLSVPRAGPRLKGCSTGKCGATPGLAGPPVFEVRGNAKQGDIADGFRQSTFVKLALLGRAAVV